MKIVKNYIYNASYQIFVLIIPLITTPYLARVLGPKGVGINSYTNSIIQYFILFGSIGINLYGNRQIAFIRDDKKKLTQTFFEIFFIRLITISISYAVFILFFLHVSEFKMYYLAQSVAIIAAGLDISWFFMGVENFAVTVLRNLIVKIITLICIFLFVKTYSDLFLYILILSFSVFFGNLTLFPYLKKYLIKISLLKIRPFKHLGPSLELFIPQIATQIYVVLNKTMLGSMTSVQAAGYFDQSDKIIKIILAVVTATGTVMLPHVSNAFAKGEYRKTKEYLYSSFNFVSVISVPMFFGLIAIASKFVPLFFTQRFIKVVPIISLEAVIILLIAWSNAIGTQYLLPTKRTKVYTTSVVLGAIVNILANIPLIMIFGAKGAAMATVISEFTVTSFQIFSIRNEIEYKSLFSETWKYLLSGVVMYVVVRFMDVFLNFSWTMIILEIFSGVCIYIVMLILFRVKILNQLKKIVTGNG